MLTKGVHWIFSSPEQFALNKIWSRFHMSTLSCEHAFSERLCLYTNMLVIFVSLHEIWYKIQAYSKYLLINKLLKSIRAIVFQKMKRASIVSKDRFYRKLTVNNALIIHTMFSENQLKNYWILFVAWVIASQLELKLSLS